MPILMAKELTFPDVVNSHNIELMKKLILNGPENYPGANYLQKANG